MDELLQEMIDPPAPRADKPRRRRMVATVAILGLAAVGVTSLTTGALFTDTEGVDGTIATGTINLATDASSDFTFDVGKAGMAPGDTVVAPLKVTNAGTLELRFAVSYLAADAGPGADPNAIKGSGTLSDVLHLEVFTVDSRGGCTPDATPGATDVSLTKPLKTSETPLLGKPATGQDDGDQVLGSGADEFLCFRASLPKSVGNAYQNTSTKLSFTFDAEQTVNNK